MLQQARVILVAPCGAERRREAKRHGGTPGRRGSEASFKEGPVSRAPRVGDFIESTRSLLFPGLGRRCRRSQAQLQHGRTVRRVVVPDGRDLEVSAPLETTRQTPCASPPGREEVPPGAGAGPRPHFGNRFRKAPSWSDGDGGVDRTKIRGCQSYFALIFLSAALAGRSWRACPEAAISSAPRNTRRRAHPGGGR